MKMKKFVGQTFKEAIDLVKKELGPDAIILSSKSVKAGPFGILNKDAVEVTAAIDDSALVKPSEAQSEKDEILKEVRSLKDEIGFLKEMLRPIVPTLRISRDKKGIFNLLISQGVDPQFAMIIVERAKDSIESLKNVIKKDIKVQDAEYNDSDAMIFMGPSGAGKTTTMSKIAYMMAARRKRVSLVSLDHQRIGSIAALKDLSRHLRCQLKVIKNVSELPRLIYKDAERSTILVDTPGYAYKNISRDLKDFFPGNSGVKRCYLMDSTMNTNTSLSYWQNGCSDTIDTIAFTKLDMATQYGALYNLSMLTGRPMSYLATGPDVPDDIKVPNSDFLANLIIGGV